MTRKKISYHYILVAICLLTVLILLLPFAGKREQPPPPEDTAEAGGEPAGEPSAGEILHRSIAAHGGMEKLVSLRSLEMRTSSILLGTKQNEHAEETAWYGFPDRLRSEARVGSESFVQVYARGEAWVREAGEVTTADMATTEILRRSLKHFPNFLVEAADSTAIVLLKGRSFIEGKPEYRVHIIEQDADETTLWIDTSDYLLRRMDYPLFTGDVEQHMQLDFESYEKREGIELPREVDIYLNGILIQQTTVLEYRLNVEVPDSLFRRPSP